jgi:hypothetical protein
VAAGLRQPPGEVAALGVVDRKAESLLVADGRLGAGSEQI